MTDIICPFCHEDRVWRVALTDEDEDGYPHAFCFECDTFWENGEAINDKTGRTFKFYMQERGRTMDYGLIQQGPPAVAPKHSRDHSAPSSGT
jgi:hypothetical protein